ncbi:MAG TPA: mechanosensitive ion channel domain-containing protein [Candidatus Sulfotelmatobacter sp.]|nr:mechanosensitive ion channel domain-containing protein [Candidatus Sulfotelmatobacter sp.]
MIAIDKFAARKFAWMLLALALCLVTGAFAAAQVSSLLPGVGSKPAAQAPAANATIDPLGLNRETPRGTIVGFIRMAQEENERAAEYFQPPMKGRRVTAEEEQELAKQLFTVLNSTFPASALTSTNADYEGRGDDGRPRDEITIGGTHLLSESFPVTLVRLEDVHNVKLWFISRQTLSKVPEAYDSLQWPQVEQKLPPWLVRNRPLGMPLWQWIAIVLLAPIAAALGWAIALAGRTLFGKYRHYRGLQELSPRPLKHYGPGAMLIAVLIHYEFVRQIGTSLLYRQYYRYFLIVVIAIAGYWAITRITHWIFRGIAAQLTERGRLAERSLVSLTRRVLDVLIFVVVALLALSWMNVNVTAALAGLGIGGLAIGLGAQKTFENLLGGISILTDKAIVVGDSCKIGDRAGTVEDIGLRSTRIRTEERTVVSIPNGTVATATLENFRFRDKILCRQLVRLRYDLASDHMRYVLAQIREVLASNPKVEASTSRVRILRFGDYAVEVEIYAYILEREYGNYLAAQETLILDVLDTLDRTGGALALPSQTTIVTQDAWVNPEKAAAAKKAVESDRATLPPNGSPDDLHRGRDRS